MTPSDPDHFPSESVLACTLQGGTRAERERWLAKLKDRAQAVDATPDGVIATFAAGSGLEAELRTLARAEAACCPFLDLEVRTRGGMIELAVSGPSEARPIIDAMFAGRC